MIKLDSNWLCKFVYSLDQICNVDSDSVWSQPIHIQSPAHNQFTGSSVCTAGHHCGEWVECMSVASGCG